jgi:hypothetical protein
MAMSWPQMDLAWPRLVMVMNEFNLYLSLMEKGPAQTNRSFALFS